MPVLILSSANLRFAEGQLVWRTYTAAEALPTTVRVERIEAVTTWPEPKSVRDIFYRRFIQPFSKIAAPLTSMLKTRAQTAPKGQW